MRTAYTSISPVSTTYSTIHHICRLRNLGVDRAIVNVWDTFVYEHPAFVARMDPTRNRREQLEIGVRIIEGVLRSLDIDYRITYLSESWPRMFRKARPTRAFSRVLSSITFRDIKEKASFRYPYFDEFTLSKMNYIIADYLIATYLHEVHPELATAPAAVYLTGERFRVFGKTISSIISKIDPGIGLPDISYVKDFPFITDPVTDVMPSIEMSLQQITTIVASHNASTKMDASSLLELFVVLGDIITEGNYLFEGKKMKSQAVLAHASKNPSKIAAIIAENLVAYHETIRSLAKPRDLATTKSLLVADAKSFDHAVRPLNELKLSILSLCDGRRTSFEIAKELDVPLPTVSVYFGRLRQMGMISTDRRPHRLIKNIVVDLEGMGQERQ
ncbi:ArsR family transcriptional regulator [Candidatus Woesearchaeota archaeon]|nr:ArsR family transcriptional regulator [Candidatus Woesearchaeota archaeon]